VKRIDDKTATRSGAEAAAEVTRAGRAQPAWAPGGSARQQINGAPTFGGEQVRTTLCLETDKAAAVALSERP
jgi:hypothetical protein